MVIKLRESIILTAKAEKQNQKQWRGVCRHLLKKKTEAEEPTYFNDAIIKLTKTIRKKEMKNRSFSKIETAI